MSEYEPLTDEELRQCGLFNQMRREYDDRLARYSVGRLLATIRALKADRDAEQMVSHLAAALDDATEENVQAVALLERVESALRSICNGEDCTADECDTAAVIEFLAERS